MESGDPEKKRGELKMSLKTKIFLLVMFLATLGTICLFLAIKFTVDILITAATSANDATAMTNSPLFYVSWTLAIASLVFAAFFGWLWNFTALDIEK